MKRIALLVILLTAVSLVVFSQAGCETEPTTNRAVPTPSEANTNSGKETVDKAAIEAELKRIESDWPRIYKERDIAAVRRIEGDDIVQIYPDGALGNKDQDLKDIEAGVLTADSWEVTDLNVNVLDGDAAVVTGRAIVKGGKLKMPNGRTMDISGQYRFADTYAKRNGQWQMVAAATVPVRQPPSGSTSSPAASPKYPPSPPPASPKPKY